MSKILVDEKALNKLLYSVRFHIELIKTDNFFSIDDVNLNKMRESINKMCEAVENFESPVKVIKQLKRKAYTKYIDSKKELISARKLNDPDLITYCEGINKKDLDNYIKIKEACDKIENTEKENS